MVPLVGGLAATREIKRESPRTKVLVLDKRDVALTNYKPRVVESCRDDTLV